ncbi:hypothetical protein [Hyphobacterium marinum]|uniref:Uncharacterized protein n=1 Tax=Hyphobacterium marinum TaxID=3116574 RepID=A0ABU7LX53_9PROT|nr:hypothetical protein [Hyphobacterium sp. Y6023]MEE2566149.1 hypothetical protein [Hyphobacterium sp. Y6023]
MRFDTVLKAAGASALAAFSCAGPALAQDDFHALNVVEGYWGWVVPDGENNPGSCEDDPVHIWLSEDRHYYYSEKEGSGESAEGPILSTDPRWIVIQYEGEERLTEAGEPVAWVLFMDSRDEFRWIRRDWIGTGRSTYSLVRCNDVPAD